MDKTTSVRLTNATSTLWELSNPVQAFLNRSRPSPLAKCESKDTSNIAAVVNSFLFSHLRQIRLTNEFDNKRLLALRKGTGKFAPRLEVDDMTSDSSAEEDVREASAAPEPDAGVTYSFDAPRGPALGSEILNMAINKAVERFENKETEKLIKSEYEVVGKDTDIGQEGYIADDDDYELV